MQGTIMAKLKKTLSDKEQDLKNIIAEAKKKLEKLQSKQRMEIGDLACKYGLHEFDLETLEVEFKKLSDSLKK